jgi:hypothetical protein
MGSSKVTFHINKHQQERSGILPLPINFTPSTWFKKEGDDSVMLLKLCSNPTNKNASQYKMQSKFIATTMMEQ